MEKISMREILPYVNPHTIPDSGKFELEYSLPDGRSVTLSGHCELIGHMAHAYFSERKNGVIDFSLYDWEGYDAEGNIIPVDDTTWFENQMNRLLND